MPAPFFDLKTEVDYYSNVLVVDELGEASTVLVDSLLNHGCQIYYYGREKNETFHYLSDKNNFIFLNSFSEVQLIKRINYLFYFPAENGKELLKEEELLGLAEKFVCKVLISCSSSSSAKEKYLFLTKKGELNLRLVVFDDLFGPRIKAGVLGQLLQLGIWEKQGTISENRQRQIFPLSVNALAGELIRLIFATDTKGKAYHLLGERMGLNDFVSLVKKFYPSFEVNFFGGGQEERADFSEFGKIPSFEKISPPQNLEEEIEKTVDWFGRNRPVKPVESQGGREVLPEAGIPLFETELESSPLKKEEPQGFGRLQEEMAQPPLEPAFIEEREDETNKKKDLDFLFQSKKKEKGTPSPKKDTPISKRILLGASLFFLLLFLFFILPLILSGSFGLLGIRALVQAKKEIDQGRFSLAIKRNDSAQNYFKLSRKIVSTTEPFYALMGLGKEIGSVNETFLFAQNVSESFKFSLSAGSDFIGWAGDFLNGGGGNKDEAFSSIKANLAFAYEQASLAQSSLPKVEAGFNFFRQNSQFEKIKSFLPESRSILLKGQTLLGVLAKILGVTEKKTYLVLFQNNAELRPTGGFIGSFALVNLENGRLIDFEVFDVYQADGQLKGHVEPPAKLKEYLGEATWYLRDSNWDPDFAVSAKRAQWFLDKEMQVAVDGTVAVTLEAARKMVAALGEVAVPEYQEKITKDNLFQKAEYYAELATFPGSTQKKDFLGSLAQSLFEKIKGTKGKGLVNIGGAVFASLDQKEIIMYFNDPEAESVVSSLNWGGNIREYRPSSDLQPIFSDYLFLNEANVGINKANYFVERKIDHQITLGNEGGLEEKLTITYDNQSPSDNWPAGRYKNYLRLYLPKGARITSVLATDPKNPRLWLPFDFKYFDSSEEHNKSLFGFLFEVPIKTKRIIEIKYELDQNLDSSRKLNSYLLLLQKQPGAYPSDYTLTFLYPPGFVPLRVIPSAVVGNGQLLVKGKLDRDLVFQIDLAH